MRTLKLFPSLALVLALLSAMLLACGEDGNARSAPDGNGDGRSSTVAPTAAPPAETHAEGAPTPAKPSVAGKSDSVDVTAAAPMRPTATAAATAAPAPSPAAAGGPAIPAGPAGSAGEDPGALPTAAPAAVAESEDSSAVSDRDSGSGPYQPASLSAGEVDDNERWEDYLQYLERYEGPTVHRVDVSERHIITVLDNDGNPVPNAIIRVSSGEEVLFKALTYADGQTIFLPKSLRVDGGIESFRVSAEKNGVSQAAEFSRGSESGWRLTLDAHTSYGGGVPLDVLFLLDSTGSMADEIEQIKSTLLSISARVSDLPSRPDLRFGMVSYRDRGDEYVTRLYDFDADVARFSDTIRNVQADGGDDYPESLNEALHVAVHRPEWRLGDALRLVFLLADAPPHLDYQDDFDYAVEMVEARTRGIKIFPVASSGLDSQGEYIFRQIAQHTMGRFIFLLYQGYGEGLGTPHDVDEYTVERLDDLVVRLIEEELAVLSLE